MQAAERCAGEVIAFCDQDDVWSPDKLAAVAAVFKQPDVILFHHDCWLIDQAGARIRPGAIFKTAPLSPPLSAHALASPYGFSMAVRRSLLRFSYLWDLSVDCQDAESRMPHDQWFYFLASIFGAVAFSEARLVGYRQHGGNVFGIVKADWMAELRARLRRWTANPHGRYMALLLSAQSRASVLAAARPRLSGVWAERAALGEDGCRRLADRLALRLRIYGDEGLPARAGAALELCRAGAYRADGGFGLGRNGLIRDVLCAGAPRSFFMSPMEEADDLRRLRSDIR